MLQTIFVCLAFLSLAAGNTINNLFDKGYEKSHGFYGEIGYGKHARKYRSNTSIRTSQLCEKSEVVYASKAIAFVKVRFPKVFVEKVC